MKILHTSDWHLGKRLDDFSRLPEQKDILCEIEEIANRENVDAIIISGDLFDTFTPPVDALNLFYRSLKRMTNNGARPIIAIAGNHDSPDRIAAPDPLARECGIILIGYPNTVVDKVKLDSGVEIINTDKGFAEIVISGNDEKLRIIHTPYANGVRMRQYINPENDSELRETLQRYWKELSEQYCDDKGVNILATHLFVVGRGEEPQEEPDDEKPILHVGGAQAIYTDNFPDNLQYVALGHLHRPQLIKDNRYPICYSGSPLSYSFSEASQQKYVNIVDVKAGEKAEVKRCELTKGRPLVRKTFDNIDAAVEWLSENEIALVELTIKADEYLTAADRKRLNAIHNGIISIIPDIKNRELISSSVNEIDLKKSREELFKEFFLARKGQNVNDEILDLFREITAEEEKE